MTPGGEYSRIFVRNLVTICTEDSESTDEVTETFILCRSRDRKEKDKAIVQRAADKIAERLALKKARCEKQNRDQLTVSREIGRLLGQNTIASHLFEVKVLPKDTKFASIEWQIFKPATDWHELSDGCYQIEIDPPFPPPTRSAPPISLHPELA